MQPERKVWEEPAFRRNLFGLIFGMMFGQFIFMVAIGLPVVVAMALTTNAAGDSQWVALGAGVALGIAALVGAGRLLAVQFRAPWTFIIGAASLPVVNGIAIMRTAPANVAGATLLPMVLFAGSLALGYRWGLRHADASKPTDGASAV